MSPETVSAILRARPAEASVEAWLAGELSRLEQVRARRGRLDREADDLQRHHTAALAELAARRAELQRGCPHYRQRCQHGAWGGDSEWVCEDCGKQGRDLR